MHLKQKRYCLAVLLVYTITILTLPSGGSDLVLHPAQLTLHNVRRRVLTSESITTHHPPGQEDRQRRHPDPRVGEESTHLHQNFHKVKDKELEHMKTSVGMGSPTDQTMTVEGERRRSSVYDLREDCMKGEIRPVVYGKIFRRVHQEISDSNSGHRPVQTGEMEVRGQHISWQKLQPVVECGDKSMTVIVRRRWAAQLLLHRVNESSVPLSWLPPECGYSVETSRRDLSLKARYDGCHVKQEGDSYVLPLLWRGSPVQMFCPVSRVQSEAVGMPSLCCSPYGITVIVQGASVTEEPSINVRGEWTPVALVAEQCGYTLDRRDAEIVITAPFMTCGITVKDGKYTISLQTEALAFTLACPFPPTELQQAHQPVTSSPYHLTRGQNEHMPKTPEPFRWGPPFYLAPFHYPHPTYTNKYPNPDVHDANSTHTTFLHLDPQPQPDNPGYYFQQLPAVEYLSVHDAPSSAEQLKDSTRVYTEQQPQQHAAVSRVSEKHTIMYPPTSASDSTVQTEAPPSHPFNPYYHYYHHPKIPLRGPLQDPDPGPHETASVLSYNPDPAVLSPNVQQYEANSRVLSDQFDQPLPSAHLYPRLSKPHSPQPYPHHYFYYLPHYAVSNVKSSPSAAESNLNEQNTKYSTPIHPFLHSPVAADNENYNLNPHMGHSSPDGASDLRKRSPEWIKHPIRLESEDDKTRQSGPVKPEHPEYPSMYPYILSHNPYDHYFWGHYGPQASFKGAADPPTHYPSNSKPPPAPHDDKRQSTTPVAHTELMDDADISKENLHYYDLLFHLPHMSINHQQLHPAVSMNSGNEATKSESGLFSNYYDSEIDWFGHAPELEDPGFPQTPYIPKVFTQLPPFENHGEEVEMHHRFEIGDHLKANMYTPSASPCGLGTVSDFDCSISLGCCTYPVKSCTMGEYFVFVLPDYVVEPKVVLPPYPSEVSKDICRLQRLTVDPDFYIVSLKGCGVNKHVVGQMMVYLLEIQGRLSIQDLGSAHNSSSVRLMVQCVSSPGCPGEVMFHVLDPSSFVQSSSGTGRLRIATDESFTSFFPQAHLPFSSIRGRLFYLELSLLDPPDPDLRLQVHYCLAYTLTPYSSWELIYDGCPRHGASQLLPSPLPHHIQRIMISSFLSLPTQSPLSVGDLEDPEIYFWCFTEVCSAADDGCTIDCINGPNSGV